MSPPLRIVDDLFPTEETCQAKWGPSWRNAPLAAPQAQQVPEASLMEMLGMARPAPQLVAPSGMPFVQPSAVTYAVDYELQKLHTRHLAKQAFDAFLNTSGPTDYDSEYLDVEELERMPVPSPLISRTLSRGTYALLRGRDGSFKSFVALDWAACIASGHPWQGRPVEKGRVLYVAAEGAYGIKDRVRAWERHNSYRVPGGQFTLRVSTVNLFAGGPALEDLVTRVREGGYALVVLDTLRRVSGGADGNGSDMGVVVDAIDRIRHATSDGSVLVVSHTDKGDNDTRGYSGIEDDADAVWHVKRDDGMTFTVRCAKFKDGPDGEVINLAAKAVEVDGGRTSLALSEPGTSTVVTMPDGEKQRLILELIQQFSAIGIAGTMIEESFDEKQHERIKISRSMVYKTLAELAKPTRERPALIVKRGQSYYPATVQSAGPGSRP